MTLAFEKYYPLLIAIIAAVLWDAAGIVFPPNPDSLLSSTLTLAAILTGFLATAKSVLMSIAGTKTHSDLHTSGYMDRLIGYLSHAIKTSFGVCIWALVGYFVEIGYVYELVWVFLAAMAAASFVRVTNIMLLVLKSVAHE